MSYLQSVKNALATRSDIALIGKAEKVETPIRLSTKRLETQVVEAWYFRVVPNPRIYDVEGLQAVMESILPGVEPAKKCDFRYRSSRTRHLFFLGRMRYTEELGEQKTIDNNTKTVSFSGEWKPEGVKEGTTRRVTERVHKFMCDIRIDVFPNKKIAAFIASSIIEQDGYTRINSGNQWVLAEWPERSRLGIALRENGG